MIPENTPPQRFQYGPFDGYESRRLRRLQNDLGIEEAAAQQAILHLRGQIIELQSHIHQLEAELAAQDASQQIRLARYREFYTEAIWIELELPD